jgi:dTDP-4-amino-4,6-dideoxygalactose transaminase
MGVFIGSTPNAQQDDVLLARDALRGKVDTTNSLNHLREELGKEALFFNKGREALYFFLKQLNLSEGDEVITQAFTCVAVVAPILWVGAKPVYVDINPNTFNMNPEQLRSKVSNRTRVIILQHTFGNIINVSKVRMIVDEINKGRERENEIYLVEDCAHLFTKNLQELNIGQYSDMYFFSFSQDKSISCTQGAMLVVNNQELKEIIDSAYLKLGEIPKKEAKYCARYVVIWDRIKRNYFKKILPIGNITLGKIQIILCRALGLIKRQASFDTLKIEGAKKMSKIQASMLLNQLHKLEELNKHRQNIVNIYAVGLKNEFKFNSSSNTLIRYPILLGNRNEIKRKFAKEGVIAGIWYSTPVFPLNEKELERVGYVSSQCPNAERCMNGVLNLPTNIEVTEDIARKIVDIINTFAKPLKI